MGHEHIELDIRARWPVLTRSLVVLCAEDWNIGAAFWGLLASIAVSWLLEQSDFKAGLR